MTLQNNFTTPEQSKQLLAIGLPADSADCYINTNGNTINVIPEDSPKYSEYCKSLTYLIPCWSVGRLIEIMLICDRTTGVFNFLGSDRDLPEVIIRHIDEHLTKYDFSKLEK